MTAVTWAEIIAVLKVGLAAAGTLDPAIAATTAEIAALTDIAKGVVGQLSTQTGQTEDQVIAGLTPEDQV